MDFKVSKARLASSELAGRLAHADLLELFWNAETLRFPAGTAIFQRNAVSDGRFIVLFEGEYAVEGKSEVFNPAKSGQGHLMGEVGLLNPRHKRTATVIAKTDCQAFVWTYEKLPESLRKALEPLFSESAFTLLATELPRV